MTTSQALDTTTHGAPALTLADILTVIAWRDPVVEDLPGAIPTASDDALIWYVPLVGTSGLVMAHRFATYAADGLSHWTVEDVARTFGMGLSVARVRYTLDRLERFGIAYRRNRTVAIRLWLAPLSHAQRSRLPAYLAAACPTDWT